MSGEIQVKSANFVDEKILSLADTYSATEISEMLAGRVTPEQVAARTKFLLKERDWLTLAEQDRLITHKLNKILTKLEDRFLDLDNAMAQVKILKEIGNRLDKRAAATTVDLNALYGNQALLMGQAIELAFQKMFGALRERYPELEEIEAREMLKAGLEPAMNEIEARQAPGE